MDNPLNHEYGRPQSSVHLSQGELSHPWGKWESEAPAELTPLPTT